MLLRYLPCTRIQLKPYNQTFIKTIGIHRMLKKSKSNGIANILSKVFLIAFFLVVTATPVASFFFAPTCAFKPLAGCMP